MVLTQRDALIYILVVGLIALFVLACVHVAYTRTLNAAWGLEHDPTAIPPYLHSQATHGGLPPTEVQHLDP